jgi:hypothetical protein
MIFCGAFYAWVGSSSKSTLFSKVDALEVKMICNFFLRILGRWFHTYLYPSLGADESQWVVMAACHGYLWHSWWLDTLWVALIRLWPHSLSCHYQFVEISLQSHICVMVGGIHGAVVLPWTCVWLLQIASHFFCAYRVWFPFRRKHSSSLMCCQIWELYNLIICSSLNYSQVNLKE